MHTRNPRRVGIFSEEMISKDLEKYRIFALEQGAAGAAVLRGDQVHVDSRVRIKCCIPKCPEYGSSAHCPPHALDPDTVRELVQPFKYALLIKVEVPAQIIAGKSDAKINEQGRIIPNKTLTTLLKSYRKVNEIVTLIESQAFYDGHYLATAFAAGSCHAAYCNFQSCQVLRNQPCRFPLKARSSMEGSSMDVFRMAAEAGWDIYPIGMDCKPADVPHGTLVGLVLIE
jgi:predicted metal-binding protein